MDILTEMFGTNINNKKKHDEDVYQGIQRYDPTKDDDNDNDDKKEKEIIKSKENIKEENNFIIDKGRRIETKESLSSLFANDEPFTFFNKDDNEKKDNNNENNNIENEWFSLHQATLKANEIPFKDNNEEEEKENMTDNIEKEEIPDIENTFMCTETEEQVKEEWLKWKEKYNIHIKLQIKRKRNEIPLKNKKKFKK